LVVSPAVGAGDVDRIELLERDARHLDVDVDTCSCVRCKCAIEQRAGEPPA
jgi:hypothetical protein